jgi:HSP20 family protein
MDLHENADSNIATATIEFTGLKREDINILVQNGSMTISAENKVSSKHEESGYAVRERQYGKWSRTLQVPQSVQLSEIKATMENGLLTVTFPKPPPEAAPKRITIL